MPWRQRGRATVDPRNPNAFAVCDRCGFWYNHSDLHWQFAYAGNSLLNIKLLVCNRCLDVPYEFNRPIILGPDPMPIRDPRPELNFGSAQQNCDMGEDNETWWLLTDMDEPIMTDSDNHIEVDH